MGCEKLKIQDYFTLRNQRNASSTTVCVRAKRRHSTTEALFSIHTVSRKQKRELRGILQKLLDILLKIYFARSKSRGSIFSTYTCPPAIPNSFALSMPATRSETLALTKTRSYDSGASATTHSTLRIFAYDPIRRVNSMHASFLKMSRNKETHLKFNPQCVYYNHRYYSPELGRWLSRDPVAEQGGLNLYAMVYNDAINWWDILGQGVDAKTRANPIYQKFKDKSRRRTLNILGWKETPLAHRKVIL